MITGQVAATALASLISLCSLWCLFWWAYRDYRVDCLRQQLFELRDGLFDHAEEGHVDFDSPAYGVLRATTNGFIRFAHKISFSRIAILMALTHGIRGSAGRLGFQSRWDHAKRDLSPQSQEYLEAYVKRMHLILLKHMILSSPALVFSVATIIVPVALMILWKACIQRILAMLSGPFEQIDNVAVALGH